MATRSLLRPTSAALRSAQRQVLLQCAFHRIQPAASPALVRFKTSKSKSKTIAASEVESPSSSASSRKGKGREAVEEEDAAAPGDAFDLQRNEENLKRIVTKLKETVGALVGSFGRVDPSLLDSVRVQQPGEKGAGYALPEVATVGVRDGSLIVSCFDAEMSKHVEKAIYAANLGLAPQAAGEQGVLRVPIPKPTSETRAALQKEVAKICENGRASVRAARHSARDAIAKDKQRKQVSTDEAAKESKKVDDATKKYTAEVDALFEQMKKRVEQN